MSDPAEADDGRGGLRDAVKERLRRSHQPPPRPRTLEEIADERRLKNNDCRECKNYNAHESGMNYGWCGAFDAWVKLYHPAGEFYSQCRFKSIQRPKREASL